MSVLRLDDALRQRLLAHYAAEAAEHGTTAACAIKDPRIRAFEIDAIARYLKDGERVLELGCGNGFTAVRLAERLAIDILALDLCPAMIREARRQSQGGLRGRARFAVADVVALDAVAAYDSIYTERALQNLLSWEEQKRALARIAVALKPGGQYVMLECFVAGHRNLNQARRKLDLSPMDVPWYNRFFEEEVVKAHMADLDCRMVGEDRFLSGYYVGKRILYSALLPKGGTEIPVSILDEYFAGLESRGDFCPMKILRFART